MSARGPGLSLRVVLLVVVFQALLACSDEPSGLRARQDGMAPPNAISPTIDAISQVDLGTLGGSDTHASAINDAGQVVGSSSIAGDDDVHAFLWTAATGMRDLGTLGGSFSEALGINAQGEVVGQSTIAGEGATHSFLWTEEGGMRDIGSAGPSGADRAQALNGLGHVAGGGSRAFLWTPERGYEDLGTLNREGYSTTAYGINDADQVTGRGGICCLPGGGALIRAFVWTRESGMRDLGTLGGNLAQARAINNSGQIVGGSTFEGETRNHAFLWSAEGGMQDLGSLGGNTSVATAISDAGQVVGYSNLADGQYHAFLWTASDGMEDLFALTGPAPAAINSHLQIAGGRTVWSVRFHTNQPPTAQPVEVSTVTNTSVDILLAGADPDRDVLSYTVATAPQHGTLTGSAANPTYTPETEYEGADSFTYFVTDQKGLSSDPATVSITINHINRAPTAVPGGNNEDHTAYRVGEGVALQLDGSASTDRDGDALTYHWDFGDGSSGSGARPTHRYVDNAVYTASLTVDDGQGGQDTKTVVVTVVNLPPSVSVPPTAVVIFGDRFTLDGSFHDSGANDGPWSYAIIWGDGGPPETGTAAAQGAITASHTYSAAGQFVVRLVVTDKDHDSQSGAVSLTVDAPPHVITPGGPYSGNEGVPITVGGRASDPEDGTNVHYDWDFGDGTAHVSGSTAFHTYADNGTYRVTLVVIDQHGARSAPATTSATIVNVAPTATFAVPASVNEGSDIVLSLQNVVEAAGDLSTLRYFFDCGDGGGLVLNPSNTRACPTTDNGNRNARAQIADKDGGVTSYAATVSILNAPPLITITPIGAVATKKKFNLNFRFTDSGTLDSPWVYEINWGDGSKNTGPTSVQTQGATITQTSSYKNAGTYTITVKVTDKDGGVRLSSVQVVAQ